MKRLTGKSFWDAYWADGARDDSGEYLFHPLLRRYLPQGGSYLEIGCAPGTAMAHFYRRFGYRVTGVDFSSVEQTRATLARCGVADARVIEADFLDLTLDERFDVVASYGFVEHFDEFEWIIEKQAGFVKPGGHLVVEVPNLRYGNGLLYRLFDRDLLALHNLRAMSPAALSRPLAASGEFEILYADYHMTCFLYFDAANPWIAGHPWRRQLVFGGRAVLSALRLDDVQNRWFSPYIIVIARRYG